MGQTPMSMGLCTLAEMDPRWFQAVELIEGESNRIQNESLKRGRPDGR